MGGPGCARDLSRDQQVAATADTDDFSDTRTYMSSRPSPAHAPANVRLSVILSVCVLGRLCMRVFVCVSLLVGTSI